MNFRSASAIAAIALFGFLTAASSASACDLTGNNPRQRANNAIRWASALVEWHASRRVATAEASDTAVFELQATAEAELANARDTFEDGSYGESLEHAETVASLIDN